MKKKKKKGKRKKKKGKRGKKSAGYFLWITLFSVSELTTIVANYVKPAMQNISYEFFNGMLFSTSQLMNATYTR